MNKGEGGEIQRSEVNPRPSQKKNKTKQNRRKQNEQNEQNKLG